MNERDILLKDLEKFYSRSEPDGGSGYDKIRAIVTEKINGLIDGKETEWSRLAEEVKRRFPRNFVMDHCFYQFPNYVLLIQMTEGDFSHGRHTQVVVLIVSLLTNFYTLYLEETFVFKHIEAIDRESSQIRFYRSVPDSSVGDEINAVMTIHFPHHRFASHKMLLAYKVLELRPFPDPPDSTICEPTSLFELLFDGLTPLHNVNVVA